MPNYYRGSFSPETQLELEEVSDSELLFAFLSQALNKHISKYYLNKIRVKVV